ncbi:competence/damage-inducible protein cina-like protein [Salinarchaeum sp. Harcht-Bsk1]|uniref:CinA family protein n=1 Tax=Salinarchaeum sp. Harcht-Bsk1 TaxID=1333523 RepID=UPI0003423348|nr:CinA family protein [Salinarchaeum sp. Harcht-Bsk1]AGN00844.1 competence/damage-inducible protein cina-like protein [Salinarchaeum sp. Harcht-Bsk1]
MGTDESIAKRIGEALRDREETIAVAESCTGGLVGSMLTDVPGSSDYFVGGIISYMNQTKLQQLAVSREALENHGVVSEPVAREMAQHVRDEADATWGVSTTGYAGSPVHSADHPAGTVFIGVAYAGSPDASDPYAVVEHHQFDGDRHEVKERIATQALRSTLAQIRSGD